MLQMNAAPTTTLFERLTAAARTEWEGYTHHSFVEQLGEGTLPLAAFQDYLVQDYLFLIQFARANALAAYKSRSLADIQGSADALGAILTETELHVRLTEGGASIAPPSRPHPRSRPPSPTPGTCWMRASAGTCWT